jgi:hypothetical protein
MLQTKEHCRPLKKRQSLFSRLAGYGDTNDAERLSVDPATRQVVGGKITKMTKKQLIYAMNIKSIGKSRFMSKVRLQVCVARGIAVLMKFRPTAVPALLILFLLIPTAEPASPYSLSAGQAQANDQAGTLNGPLFTNWAKLNTNVVLNGLGGSSNGDYTLLTSTNLTLSLTNWTAAATNSFDSNGCFNLTVPIISNACQQYYTLKVSQTPLGSGLNYMRGCNKDWVVAYQSAGIPVSGERYYCEKDNVPDVWPARPTDPNGTVYMCVSIYPNVSNLLNGAYDSKLTNFMTGSLFGDMLNCWHEASNQNYVDGNGEAITGPDETNMLVYLYNFAKRVHANCVVGAIENTTWNSNWIPPGLDFYGMDVYYDDDCDPTVPLNKWAEHVYTQGYGATNATVSVCECNASEETNRPCYFYEAANWVWTQAHNGPRCFLTYWGTEPGHPLSGPFVTNDLPTITELNSIANQNYSAPANCGTTGCY